MPPLEDIDGLKKKIIDDLNELSCLIGRFDYMIHGPAPEAAQSRFLDPLASVYWSADLAETLANNTSEFRDNLIIAEKIREGKVSWPEVEPIDSSVGDDDIWLTIQMTVSMELGTFQTMTSQYQNFGSFKWDDRQPLGTIHDLLHEILLNTNNFIASENNSSLFKNVPVQFEQPPAPIPPDGPERPAIVKLEHELRRYIEIHMQIATFIPAHLRNAPTRKFRRLPPSKGPSPV